MLWIAHQFSIHDFFLVCVQSLQRRKTLARRAVCLRNTYSKATSSDGADACQGNGHRKNLIQKILERPQNTLQVTGSLAGEQGRSLRVVSFYVTPLHSSDQNQEDFVWLATVREFHGS